MKSIEARRALLCVTFLAEDEAKAMVGVSSSTRLDDDATPFLFSQLARMAGRHFNGIPREADGAETLANIRTRRLPDSTSSS